MIEATGNDLVVIADDPHEMVQAQKATIDVIASKITLAQQELADANETLAHLTEAGMSTAAATRAVRRAEDRIEYLSKAKEALESGYVIVPEMPCEVIAIRVKKGPAHQHAVSEYGMPSIGVEQAPALPRGEGDYADPIPPTTVKKFTEKRPTGGEVVRTHRTTTGDWKTDIMLPAEFLRPTVVQRTGKMMMRKLFDEIAVIGAGSRFSNSRAKKADPMIVGSIVDRSTRRKLWFLVAWFVDTSTI